MRVRLLIVPAVAALVLACGDSATDRAGTMRSRPVAVLELTARDFPRERALTGSVSLYREEQIGFEVAGRVLFVLDRGREVRGPAFNEKGELVRRGDRTASAPHAADPLDLSDHDRVLALPLSEPVRESVGTGLNHNTSPCHRQKSNYPERGRNSRPTTRCLRRSWHWGKRRWCRWCHRTHRGDRGSECPPCG